MHEVFSKFPGVSINAIAFLSNFVLELLMEEVRIENLIDNIFFFSLDLNRFKR